MINNEEQNYMSMLFGQSQILTVWQKAATVPGMNPAIMRQDACRAWIKFGDYGNRNSQYGWEIDHNFPVALGGSDAMSNLRPLHWQNNCRKADGNLACAITARV